RGPVPGHRRQDGARRPEHLQLDPEQVGGPRRRPDLLPRPVAGQRGRGGLGEHSQVRCAAGGPDQPLGHVPVRRRARGRRDARPRGDRLEAERRPALLLHAARHGGGRGDGDDRPRVRRAHRARAADGVRAGTEPPHRTADGGCCRMTTVTETDAMASALELEHVESHLHPEPSYDVADHPKPTGREEIWRFTPLKRLRGLLDGAPSDACLQWKEELPQGVTLSTISTDEAKALGGIAPLDRLAALAVENAGGAALLTIDGELDRPARITLSGDTIDRTVDRKSLG